MKPTAEQILQAAKNHNRPARTHGAHLRDALHHVRESSKKKARVRRA